MSKRVLVLIGGGHAHVQVILNLPPSVTSANTCVLISDVTHAAYSGLLPAVISGLTPEENAYTALRPFAEAHNFHFLHAPVTNISSSKNQLTYITQTSSVSQRLRYDILSLDVGSRTLPIPVSSTSAPVIMTRPIGELLPALRRLETDAPPAPHITIVGAGAAGVELALALDARMKNHDPQTSMTLVSKAPVSDSFGSAMGKAVDAELAKRGVNVVNATAKEVGEGVLKLSEGGSIMFDALVLATGASPHEWLERSTDLKTESGWVYVGDDLRVYGRNNVFAAGDCATFGDKFGEGFPPKAGVFAVRQGPVLTHNLKVLMEGKGAVKAFKPQTSYLSLLCTGDGRGIGSKYGLVFTGTWVFRLKSFIDEAWQQKFRVGGGGKREIGNSSFEGSPAEGAAILQAGEDVLVGDSFESQLMILKRMDSDVEFRGKLLDVAK